MSEPRVRVPIRCCCDAGLVLGTVEIPKSLFQYGCRVAFFLVPEFYAGSEPPTAEVTPDNMLALDVAEARDALMRPEDVTTFANAIDATAVSFRERRELAIKSNNTPLDTLRRIPGFVEVNQKIEIGFCHPIDVQTIQR